MCWRRAITQFILLNKKRSSAIDASGLKRWQSEGEYDFYSDSHLKCTYLWMCSLFCYFSWAQQLHDILGSFCYSRLDPGMMTQLLHPQVQRADDGLVWRTEKGVIVYSANANKRPNGSRDSPITSLFSKLSPLAWLALRICILMNSIFVLLSWSICCAVASNLRSCETNCTSTLLHYWVLFYILIQPGVHMAQTPTIPRQSLCFVVVST